MSSPEPRDCIPAGDGPQQESQQLGSDIIGERTEYPKADGSTPKTSPFSSNYENTPLGLSPNMMMEAERRETNDNDSETVGMAGTSATAGSFGPNHDLINMNTSAQNIERLAVSCRGSGGTQTLALKIDVASTSPSSPQVEKPYLDPTPKTPQVPQSPLEMPTDYTDKDLPQIPADIACDEDVDKPAKIEAQNDEDSQSEIQSIMDQFTDDTKHLGPGELMSPRLELAEQFLPGQAHFPPRKSSLEPIVSPRSPIETHVSNQWQSRPSSVRSIGSQIISPPAVPPKSPSTNSQNPAGTELAASSNSVSRPPPPEPEPDQPFDFHRFLEQLRHRTADPVAKFLRSFLTEFGKKQWMVHEQVKIISDFLAFITNKMAQCEVWREISDVEFDNAKEGIEKLVMNRLYSQTFSPAIPPPPAPSRSRSRGQKKDTGRYLGPGRRGQHQEDVERDEVLAQKVRIYSWVREEHLDIPPVGPNGRRFLALAQQELLKIKGYRAPRDKVICVLNCCKVIFGLLRNAPNGDTSADSFVPLLIYVVLKANPEHLVSNIQYILRFRNQEKLAGEAGYYLSSLSGAIQFIETLDRTSLTISDEEFERNVEAAVSAIAERSEEAAGPPLLQPEKSTLSEPEVTPRNSTEGESYAKRKDSYQFGSSEDNVAVAGLLRTIQKPLSTIGRIFSEESPHPVSQQRTAPQNLLNTQQTDEARRSTERQRRREDITPQQISKLDAQEAAARQASAEAAEARRIQRAEHVNVVETLSGMFPNLDKDLIDDVVRMKEGRVGLAVDACLALSAE
ncbi:vacuolar sorting-associated protein [Histoplasma ohiense]|nr:vacuolar sorting-associated protein [Histoplasma ohiense (nom. inval.)]